MSTATAPQINHLPHTAHPLPLREQAFTLHCQGLRSPAIAAELGVPERTIRAWIAAALDELKDDLQLNRKEQLLLAVERQHQLTATAWQQFEREAAARDTLLDSALQATLNPGNAPSAPDSSARPLHLHLPASTPAPRYLSLIIQANKEINRLLGLHTLAKLHLLNMDIPTNEPVPLAESGIPAESATDSDLSASSVSNLHTPAESATEFPLSSQGEGVGGEDLIPAKTATAPTPPLTSVSSVSSVSSVVNSRIPAESATSPLISALRSSPCPSVNSVFSVVERPLPAKTATGIADHSWTEKPGMRSRRAPTRPQPWMM